MADSIVTDEIDRVIAGLCPLEREWLTGWQGVGGAAFNAIGEGMAEMGLTISYTNWNLSEKGLAVRARLQEQGRG